MDLHDVSYAISRIFERTPTRCSQTLENICCLAYETRSKSFLYIKMRLSTLTMYSTGLGVYILFLDSCQYPKNASKGKMENTLLSL